MSNDKKTPADMRNEALAQRYPDPPEQTKGEMPEVVAEAMAMLRQKAPLLRAPVPQGLSDFDALGVVQRRSQLQAQVANAEGVVAATLQTARACRMITVEQFREGMAALEVAVNGQESMPFMDPRQGPMPGGPMPGPGGGQ